MTTDDVVERAESDVAGLPCALIRRAITELATYS
jgi:hypothetical protein